jgi:hypothetical protein
MSTIIKRLGTQKRKYKFQITIHDLKLAKKVGGELIVRWSKKPSTADSISTMGENGLFTWNQELQDQKPMIMTCTLYFSKGAFQSKDSVLMIKKKINRTDFETVCTGKLDLAQCVELSGAPFCKTKTLTFAKSSKAPEAKLTFSIASMHLAFETDNELSVSRMSVLVTLPMASAMQNIVSCAEF